MHDLSAGAPGSRPVGLPVKTVPAPYRTAAEIRALVDRICGQPETQDQLTTKRTLGILDDLAEEMIGRRAPADVATQVQIEQHCARLRASIARPMNPPG